MARHSTGKNAVGFCDRCGLRYKLASLREEIVDSVPVGNLVCESCYDKDHPQIRAGRKLMDDPGSLRNPRSDQSILSSRSMGRFNPVRGVSVLVEIGSVRV